VHRIRACGSAIYRYEFTDSRHSARSNAPNDLDTFQILAEDVGDVVRLLGAIGMEAVDHADLVFTTNLERSESGGGGPATRIVNRVGRPAGTLSHSVSVDTSDCLRVVIRREFLPLIRSFFKACGGEWSRSRHGSARAVA
jgi:hypothetical protein